MKKTLYATARYDINDNFYVEVTPNGKTVEFVLCMKDFGLKNFMFTLHSPYSNQELEEWEKWEELIKEKVEEHIEIFLKYRYNVFESGFLEEHGFWDEDRLKTKREIIKFWY